MGYLYIAHWGHNNLFGIFYPVWEIVPYLINKFNEDLKRNIHFGVLFFTKEVLLNFFVVLLYFTIS